ncbi:MAG: J domain-containing protein [Acidobacteria bacterium]|nr:J domain-containing protein [Acidobacteriota bacterium]
MDFKDYYAALGIPKTASDAEIKRAFRKLARQHHPDLNPGNTGSESRFKEINEANEVLGDPKTRRKYDELGANWRAYEQGGTQYSQPHTRRHTRTVSPEEMAGMFGDDAPFSDFFTTFFSGSGNPSNIPRTPQRGRDVEQPITLTLEEAFGGASRQLQFSRPTGAHSVDVRIPAGVREGSRVKVHGEGEPGGKDMPSGDLFLVVRLLPHKKFERRGQDLYTKLTVPVTTAVLGADVSVPTLAGSSLKLRIPELTPAGRTFRLKGHGMPEARKPETRGDLFVTLEIQIPTQLTPEARAHYQALEKLAEA